MAKWLKNLCATIVEFIKTYPLLCFLVGNIIGVIVIEICFLISCGIYGWPSNWPVEWPWQFLMK